MANFHWRKQCSWLKKIINQCGLRERNPEDKWKSQIYYPDNRQSISWLDRIVGKKSNCGMWSKLSNLLHTQQHIQAAFSLHPLRGCNPICLNVRSWGHEITWEFVILCLKNLKCNVIDNSFSHLQQWAETLGLRYHSLCAFYKETLYSTVLCCWSPVKIHPAENSGHPQKGTSAW